MGKRKDSKGRVLKERERQRKDGIYEFRWYDRYGKRHSISSSSLEELREKEIELQKLFLLEGTYNKSSITINDMYAKWLKLKRGLKDNPKHMRWYPFFMTLLKTGLRAGEATGLTWNDIDFINEVIYVNRTLVYYRKLQDGKNHYIINTPKTKAGTRMVPMLPEVKEALLLEKQYQQDLGIICKAVIDGVTDFVFLNEDGYPLNYNLSNKELKRIVRDCNKEIKENSLIENPLLLPHISNHIFRHTFATRLNEANLNYKAIQAILGHSDIQTTMDIYTDATPELVQNAMNMFREHFDESSYFTAPITAPKYS